PPRRGRGAPAPAPPPPPPPPPPCWPPNPPPAPGPAVPEVRAPRPVAGITEREREVLTLVGRGLSNGEIAEELFISAATAKSHVSRLFTKLGARDRVQLVITAYEMGLVAAPR
ncbi:response regulator transcription factor, partial [Streptomyces sp. NPDC059742]|uniref:response regulator transcription factor n=1 Tax=Streptomyces sp. NPDC059742 TaxID=3346927 RepID=UPI003668EA02